MSKLPDDRITNLSDEGIVRLLAFDRDDYGEDALVRANAEAAKRGISSKEILSFRKKNLPADNAELPCKSCAEILILDSQDLVAGLFRCPECGVTQAINYSALKWNLEAENVIVRFFKSLGHAIQDRRKMTREDEVSGIGGPLVLIAITLVLGIVVGTVVAFMLIDSEDYVSAVAAAVMVGYMGILARLFFDKRKSFPTAFVVFVWLSPLLNLLALVGPNPTEQAFARFVGISIAALLWTVYISNSRRVKATFIKVGNPRVAEPPARANIDRGETVTDRPTDRVAEMPQQCCSHDTSSSIAAPTQNVSGIRCISCGTVLGSITRYCPTCGKQIELVACSSCGTAAELDHLYCSQCGAKLID